MNTKAKFLIFGTLLVLTFSVKHGKLPPINPPSFYVGGIQINEADQNIWANTLKIIGLNTVATTIYAEQQNWDSDTLLYREQEPEIENRIRVAKQNRLQVALILRVALQHAKPRNYQLWHGMIMPKTSQGIRNWFQKYGDFVVKWATVAQKYEVDILGIGSEMSSLSATKSESKFDNLVSYYIEQKPHPQDEEGRFRKIWAKQVGFYKNPVAEDSIIARKKLLYKEWVRLIERVRAVYTGKLTYASNFDNYMDVDFWSHLDMIGINAYFPLRKKQQDTLNIGDYPVVFKKSWVRAFDEIQFFLNKDTVFHKPLLFTELGYTLKKNSTLKPWDQQKNELQTHPFNYAERWYAIKMLKEVHDSLYAINQSKLKGILYWKFSTHDYHWDDETFMLHIGKESKDSLQYLLRRFASSK